MRSAWTFALVRLTAALGLAVLGGSLFGFVKLWLVAVLSLYLLWQLSSLFRLHHWLIHRKEEDPPDLGGIWGDVVAQVGRIYRRKNFHKSRIKVLFREFRRLTAAMPEGVMLLTPENEIVWFNRTAGHLLGLRR
jgi:two-component system phosphate regulon sensor histidine kinase PhoR